MSEAPKRKFIRIKDIQSVYGISRYSVYRMRNRGVLTIHKVEGSSSALVKVEELERLIQPSA